jgi:hypothetical protein
MARASFIVLLATSIPLMPFRAQAYGDFGEPLSVPIHVDLSGGWGYSTASDALAQSTKLGQWNFGATIGVLMGGVFFAGLSSDYRASAQYSDVGALDGNVSGKRWNMASPTLGFRSTAGFVVKFDYQLTGDYELANKTLSGASVRYAEPKGWRISGLYQLSGLIHASAFFESVSFGKRVNSENGEIALSPGLSMSQFGAGLGLVF